MDIVTEFTKHLQPCFASHAATESPSDQGAKTMFKRFLLSSLMLGLTAAGAAHAEKLTIWMVGDDKTPKILQPAVDAYKRKHPGVEFEVRAVPWGDSMTKYSAAIASKAGPDLITGG